MVLLDKCTEFKQKEFVYFKADKENSTKSNPLIQSTSSSPVRPSLVLHDSDLELPIKSIRGYFASQVTFNTLRQLANTPSLRQLLQYVEETWIDSDARGSASKPVPTGVEDKQRR